MRHLVLTAILCLAGCHLIFPFDAPDAPLDASAADAPPHEAAPADAPPAADALTDALPPVETGPACGAGMVSCAKACVPGDDCSACAKAPLLCKAARTCVSSCAGCVDANKTPTPIECFACDTKQENPIGTCERNDLSGYCLDADYSQAHKGQTGLRCDCSDNDPHNCLGDHHVCIKSGSTDWCTTCGEVGMNTNGLPCKNGGTCDTSLPVPRCK